MCGISGVVSDTPIPESYVKESVAAISHRGPDDVGYFFQDQCNFGMCRLAILDVARGQQPNFNSSRDIVSIFNGEIYNFLDLRQLLLSKGYQIAGVGDAALIPFLYEEFGDKFPTKIEGMFAIAIYDFKRKALLLVRDRLGKKPLWYFQSRKGIYFSSEIKGLISLGIEKQVEITSIPEFLTYGYINAPRSAYKGVNQLPPASILKYEGGVQRIQHYWNVSDVSEVAISYEDAKLEIVRLLRNAVKTRLVSERKVGAFLSGGIDSTIVAALMQEESKSPINTYSIGFSDEKFDESGFARNVAAAIGTTHRERIVEPNPVFLFETLAKVLDQPFADSSAIPTYYLSQFAREDVVVALSGDGGDESFAGYERYRVARMLNLVNPLLNLNPLQRFDYRKFPNNKIRKLIKHSSSIPLWKRYRGIQSLFQQSDLHFLLSPDLLNEAPHFDFLQMWESIPTQDVIRKMQEMDFKSYLPGDLMYKVDMTSMANGLEVRSPFLDHRLVEFGLSLPSKFKIGGGESKHILRDIARELVDPRLINRPKMGFGIPRARWLREDLKDFVKEILLGERSRARGWLRIDNVERVIMRHNNESDQDNLIWPMIMLEIWARTWID